MLRRFWVLLACLCGLPSLLWAQQLQHTTDPLPAVRKAVEEKKAVLVDVRSQAEWDKGHVEGAVLLPVTSLKAGMSKEELAKRLPRDKIIYCHCAVGARALQAAQSLKELGYDARALKPGYDALLKDGFPAAKPVPAPAAK